MKKVILPLATTLALTLSAVGCASQESKPNTLPSSSTVADSQPAPTDTSNTMQSEATNDTNAPMTQQAAPTQ